MSYWSPKGRNGRVMRAVHRCLELNGNKPTSTSAIVRWSHERQITILGRNPHNARRAVRRACEGRDGYPGLCERTGRGGGRGRPLLWRLRKPLRKPDE